MKKQESDVLAARFVRHYADMILRLCTVYSLSREDAQDICQNVFLKLLKNSQKLADPAYEKAWVLRVAINESKNLLKSAAHSRVLPLDEAFSPACPPSDEFPSDVWEAVQQLPPSHREAILLFYYEGYSAEEIASITGTSAAAVRQRLHRARQSLKTYLEQEDLYGPLYTENV